MMPRLRIAVEVGRRMGKETLVLQDPWARSGACHMAVNS